MAKINVLEYDTTAANNTDINSIGIQGTSPVSNFDNAFRELMAEIGAAVTRHVAKAAGSYTPAKTDHNQLWRATGAVTLNLTAAATLTTGWALWVKADGGAITIDPSGAETINGAATLVIPDGSGAFVLCTGTAFFAIVVAAGNVAGPASATDNAIARFDTTTGKIIQDSVATIDDSGNLVATNVTAGSFNSSTTNALLSTASAGTVLLRPNGVGSASGQFTVASTGNATVGGTLNVGAGAFGAPSLSFTGDPDTGIYSSAANEMGFAVNGAFLANMTATGFNFGRALSDPTLAGVTMQANGQLVVGMDANNAIFNRFTSDGTMIQFRRTNSTVGTIAVTTVATAYNTSSDKRLKSELREFDSGAILDGLSFGEFTWLKNGAIGHGVLAQDAEKVYPEAISQDGDGFYVADYSKFVPILAAELKALRKRVADLEALVVI
jgi:hypothetical protein